MDLYRSLVYNFSEGGVRQITKKLLSRAGRWVRSESSWLIYRSDPQQAPPEIDHRILGYDELLRWGYFKAMAFPETTRDRLRSASCHGFFIDGELANIAWTSEGYLELEPGTRIPTEEMAIFDCWTMPQFRGRGIYAASLRTLSKAGAVIAVDPWNTPSIRGIERAGFKLHSLLTKQRVLGTTRIVVSVQS